jgi:aryl-alcohol dehydrogenase-like predicted oxidoreductase
MPRGGRGRGPVESAGRGFSEGQIPAGARRARSLTVEQSNEGGRPWAQSFFTQHNFAILDVVQGVEKEMGKSLTEVSLGWLLAVRGVTSVIIGARNTQQLRQNLRAGGWVFPRELWEKIDAASRLPEEYRQDFHHFVEGLMHSDLA